MKDYQELETKLLGVALYLGAGTLIFALIIDLFR